MCLHLRAYLLSTLLHVRCSILLTKQPPLDAIFLLESIYTHRICLVKNAFGVEVQSRCSNAETKMDWLVQSIGHQLSHSIFLKARVR